MAKFDVNTDAAIELTAKLEKLHRSAFPSAVRNTLNDAALKTKSLVPKVAAQKFTTRQKTFFRSFSTVDRAKGFDLKSMRATVGINGAKSKGKKVAEGLEKQEFGGSIQGRKLIPMDNSRTSGSHSKGVAKANKFGTNRGSTAKKRMSTGKGSRGSRFISKIMAAKKAGNKVVTIIGGGGRGTMYRILNSKRLASGKSKLTIRAIYHYRNTKTSRVTPKPFMEPSAKLASRKMNEMYRDNAEFQFKKHLK